MTTANWALNEIARLLTEDERAAVLGDIEEASVSAWLGSLEIFGLLARKQLELWKNWRPWLAAFGVAMPCSFGLMGISVSVSWDTLHFLRPEIFLGPNPAVRFGLLPFVCQILVLLACAWTGGFIVGSISRRTLWASAMLCASPMIFCLSRFGIVSLSRFCLLIFLIPAIFGVRHGLRLTPINQLWTISFAIIITLSMICLRINSRIFFLDWFLVWPAWYLAIAGTRTTETQ